MAGGPEPPGGAFAVLWGTGGPSPQPQGNALMRHLVEVEKQHAAAAAAAEAKKARNSSNGANGHAGYQGGAGGGQSEIDGDIPSNPNSNRTLTAGNVPYQHRTFTDFCKLVGRMFYDDAGIVMLDFLVREQRAFTESDIRERLKWRDNVVHQRLYFLERQLLVQREQNFEKGSKSPVYWRINPHIALAVEWHYAKLVDDLKAQVESSQRLQEFECAGCQAKHSALDAAGGLLSLEDGHPLCRKCGERLCVSNSEEAKNEVKNKHDKTIQQLAPLRAALDRVRSMEPPIFQPYTRADKNEEKRELEEKLSSGGGGPSSASGSSVDRPTTAGQSGGGVSGASSSAASSSVGGGAGSELSAVVAGGMKRGRETLAAGGGCGSSVASNKDGKRVKTARPSGAAAAGSTSRMMMQQQMGLVSRGSLPGQHLPMGVTPGALGQHQLRPPQGAPNVPAAYLQQQRTSLPAAFPGAPPVQPSPTVGAAAQFPAPGSGLAASRLLAMGLQKPVGLGSVAAAAAGSRVIPWFAPGGGADASASGRGMTMPPNGGQMGVQQRGLPRVPWQLQQGGQQHRNNQSDGLN